MLYPPIDSLKSKVNSKFSLVSMVSKRARQLQEEKGGELLKSYKSSKNVGKALEEIASGALGKEVQDASIVYEDE